MTEHNNDAKQHFDAGLYCAESVLTSIAESQHIQSKLIPSIATGFCSGMSQTCGTCGALTGGILGLNIALGRSNADDSVDRNYAAVQTLVQQFEKSFGSTNCQELLGCDLGTEEGQQAFSSQNLGNKCREFTGKAADMVLTILQTQQTKS